MSTTASTPTTVNRAWIEAEFSKGIAGEQDLMELAKARALAPPDPSLGVVYNEIAAADERHCGTVETIATRYGHTPSQSVAGGIGETFGRLKDKVGEMGVAPLQRLGNDLAAKANAIHWMTAWVQTFEAIGDTVSATELTAVLNEEKTHRDALQAGLNRMVTAGAVGEEPAVVK
jgi:hypothetical protein